MKVKDLSDKFKQIKSFKDLIELSEKYDTLMIDINLIIGERGNHAMYIIYSGNMINKIGILRRKITHEKI